jgi:DNA-binding beta-propeller fold protein YncE
MSRHDTAACHDLRQGAALATRLAMPLAAFLLLAAAPAFAARRAPAPNPHPVWPPPPDSARIEFASAWSGVNDFPGNAWSRLRDFAAGDASGHGMKRPTGIAVTPDGARVYVLDAAALAVFVIEPVARRSHRIELSAIAQGPTGPFGLAMDASENLYITDQPSHAVVVITAAGRFVRAFGGSQLKRPVGCAVDPVRALVYVADAPQGGDAPHRVAVFTLEGKFVRWFGARGEAQAQFNYPTYLAVDAQGNVHVVDTLNWRVQVFDAAGKWLRGFGRHSDARGDFDRPKGIAFDTAGRSYVADGNWDRVLIFDAAGQPLLDFGGRGTWPGGLQEPTAVAIDGANRIYVADTNGHRVNVYQLLAATAASVQKPAATRRNSR